MTSKMFVVALALVIAGTARAETAYITDQLYVSLRPGQNNDDPAIKTELSGTAMEVLQHANGFAQVRDPAGVEGWIAERYLSPQAPARTQLSALQQQVAGLQQQLAQAQAQAKQALADAAAAKALAATQASAPKPEKAVNTPRASGPSGGVIAIGITAAFAMLIVGFVAGAMWLRELNRKKLGGMHLRI